MVREVKPTEEQVSMLFQDKLLEKTLSASVQPIGIIFAGVSGSGKSTLIKLCFEKVISNAFAIQADDYRRYHPKLKQYIEKYGRDEAHKKTGGFAHRMARELLSKAIKSRLNVVYETTFNNIETANSLLSIFKQHGYRVIIIALPTNVELSIKRNRQRYESKLSIEGTLPRIVEKEIIEQMAINYHNCIQQLKMDNTLSIYSVENSQHAINILSTVL